MFPAILLFLGWHQHATACERWHAAAVPRVARLSMCEDAEQLERRREMQRQAESRGAAVLAAVLLVVAWSFTVPPDIRRTVLCSPQADAALSGCVDAAALGKRVVDHYATCGTSGVPCFAWDFSLDPQRVAAQRELVGQLLGPDAASKLLGD